MVYFVKEDHALDQSNAGWGMHINEELGLSIV